MSLIVMTGTPWPNEYEGTVKWSEKTRQAHFGEHGPLFDRVFSFEEISQILRFLLSLVSPKFMTKQGKVQLSKSRSSRAEKYWMI